MSLLRPLFQRLVSPLQSIAVRTLTPRGLHIFVSSGLGRRIDSPSPINTSNFNMIITREMNRNARRPKKANHGKRPVCNARRRAKRGMLKSRAYRTKIFGFW